MNVSIEYTHPEITAQWHPTKNKIKPFECPSGSGKKVWWICSKNPLHEWEASLNDRCGGKKKPN